MGTPVNSPTQKKTLTWLNPDC